MGYVNVINYYIGPKSRDWKWVLKRQHPLAYLFNRWQWYHYPKVRKVPDFPLHIDFETSSMCNMNCPMCYRQRKDYDPSEFGLMDYDVYCKGIDECVKYGLYSIRLSWRGECTMHPRLVDMVRYAKEKGIKEVSFITNGYALEGELATELVKSKVDYITISVDDIGEGYNKIRHPSTYEGTLERLKNLRHLRDTIGNGFPRIRVNGVWNEEKGKEWFKRMWENLGNIVDYMTFTHEFTHDGSIKQLKPDFCCQYPFQRITVMWDGVIPLCIADKEKKVILGNLKDDSIYEIWHGDKLEKIRELHRNYQAPEIECCKRCDRAVAKRPGNQKVNN